MIFDGDAHVDIYRMLLDRKIDLVTFTSASAVLNFANNFGAAQAVRPARATVVAIQGDAAADAATRASIAPAVQQPAGSLDGFRRSDRHKFKGN